MTVEQQTRLNNTTLFLKGDKEAEVTSRELSLGNLAIIARWRNYDDLKYVVVIGPDGQEL